MELRLLGWWGVAFWTVFVLVRKDQPSLWFGLGYGRKTPLGHRINYLIRWVGYKKPTWNTRVGLVRDVPKLVHDFDRKFLK